jgi:copper chaperone CopZ
MNTLKFKTSLKCGGCVSAISGGMNSIAGENNWSVDLDSVDKTLIVNLDESQSAQIEEAVKKAGYQISRLS